MAGYTKVGKVNHEFATPAQPTEHMVDLADFGITSQSIALNCDSFDDYPLIVYGSNPLFIYVLSAVWVLSYSLINIGELNLGDWMYQQLALVMSAKLASFTFALLQFFVVVWGLCLCVFLNSH